MEWPRALVKPWILGRHPARQGQPKCQYREGRNNDKVEQIFEQRLAERLGIFGEQAVDAEWAIEQRKTEEIVSQREQRAVGKYLPPRPPSVGECLAHHESAAAEHNDG